MSSFPPVGGVNWSTGYIDLGEAEFLSIILIGLNEGLLFVGGGGGSFGSSAKAGLYEAQKSLAGKLADAAATIGTDAAKASANAGVITDAVFEALRTALDDMNNTDDCTGVAFAHGVAFNRKTLLYETLNTRNVELNPKADEVGIASALVTKKGCGSPDYEVPILIWRDAEIAITFSTSVVRTEVMSSDIPVESTSGQCKPEGPLLKRLVSRDQEITVSPSVWYGECSPHWTINGTAITDANGTLTVPVDASYFVGAGIHFIDEHATTNVTLRYVQTIDGSGDLRVSTSGGNGNFVLTFGLTFNFEGTYDQKVAVRDIEIGSVDYRVVGQTWTYNRALQDYLLCLRSTWAIINQRLTHLVQEIGPLPLGPLDVDFIHGRFRYISEFITGELLPQVQTDHERQIG